MNFLQPLMLAALPLVALPILIHLINQWRYQTKRWGAMMFLLSANRMNRGFARIRQWLILAMRTLAIAGLILAIARPLASGLLGMSAGGVPDTTLVLMDRSPSMQQQGIGATTKLETGRQQLASALGTLGSEHWVAVDADTGKAQAFDTLEELLNSPVLQSSSASSDLTQMLQSALEYLEANKSGATEIWICSDLRDSDWNSESGTWKLIREGFERLPQSVRFHLLAYPSQPQENLAVRVTDARLETPTDAPSAANNLLLSLQITRSDSDTKDGVREIPLGIEIEGSRSELMVELRGGQTEIRQHRIPLARNQSRGWGRVSLPADENTADNDYYFVFDDPPLRRTVVVSEERASTRALEIAADLSAEGPANSSVEVLTPDQLDSLALDNTSLLLWQTDLPDSSNAPAIEKYVQDGGQVIFFPPTSLSNRAGGSAVSEPRRFLGVSWDSWVEAATDESKQFMVENWRSDQDLLAATNSGVGLPVGQLQIGGYAKTTSSMELTQLATLSGGDPLLARVPTARGGVYFCAASVNPSDSSLAQSGIVLFIAIQRAIERGQTALGNTTSRVAGSSDETTATWRQLAGPVVLSTEFASQVGIYADEDRMFAVNRSLVEDQRDTLADDSVDSLFAGLPFARVDDQAGNLNGIVREIWRVFLILMILSLLLEALLCLPRANARPRLSTS